MIRFALVLTRHFHCCLCLLFIPPHVCHEPTKTDQDTRSHLFLSCCFGSHANAPGPNLFPGHTHPLEPPEPSVCTWPKTHPQKAITKSVLVRADELPSIDGLTLQRQHQGTFRVPEASPKSRLASCQEYIVFWGSRIRAKKTEKTSPRLQ